MSKFQHTFLQALDEDKGAEKSTRNGKPSKAKAFNREPGRKNGKYVMPKQSLKEGMYDVVSSAEAAPAGSDAPVAPAHDDSDEGAWKRTLDPETDPKDFDVGDNPQLKVDKTGVEAARDWIEKLEHMAEFVNGTGPESLNSKINDLEVKNSIPFRGVVRREEKRITKLAENLRGLAEVFKSVVIGSHKKIKDATAR